MLWYIVIFYCWKFLLAQNSGHGPAQEQKPNPFAKTLGAVFLSELKPKTVKRLRRHLATTVSFNSDLVINKGNPAPFSTLVYLI